MTQVMEVAPFESIDVDPIFMCPVEVAARIIGQKWTLQIVHTLLAEEAMRFCGLQEALGGVNPSTLSSRLKMLEEEGLVRRIQISDIPPHVEYRLTQMGHELEGVIGEISRWSSAWLCTGEALAVDSDHRLADVDFVPCKEDDPS